MYCVCKLVYYVYVFLTVLEIAGVDVPAKEFAGPVVDTEAKAYPAETAQVNADLDDLDASGLSIGKMKLIITYPL